MFEIATQFNAIFRAQTNAETISVSLLSMWVSRRVNFFLTMVKGELRPMEDSASLRDALDACVFFSASMGRLGADFTPQLPPLFEDKMHSIVLHFWREGVGQLSETLKICREAGVATPLSSSSVVTDTAGATGGSEPTGYSDGSPMAPPRQLMALPPLGRMVNAFLAGLNELRRCLLPGIFSRLRTSMEEVLAEVDEVLQSNERAVMTPGLRGDAVQLRAKAKEMRQVMTDIVTPYVRGALELSLGNDAVGKELHEKLAEILTPPIVEEEKEAAAAAEESKSPPIVEEGKEAKMGTEEATEESPPPVDESGAGVESAAVAPEQIDEGWNDGFDAVESLDDAS